MQDGSICDGSKSVVSDFNAFFCMEKMRSLKEELASKTEVKLFDLFVLRVYDTYVCYPKSLILL